MARICARGRSFSASVGLRVSCRVESRLLLLNAIPARGERLFELACERDLEGIVAKRRDGLYETSKPGWLKIKNPDYSQKEGREELFEAVREPRSSMR